MGEQERSVISTHSVKAPDTTVVTGKPSSYVIKGGITGECPLARIESCATLLNLELLEYAKAEVTPTQAGGDNGLT